MMRQVGVTLLEAMLVLAIGSAIVALSISQYLSYRTSVDAMQVQANVNSIFQGMASFYKKNCYGTVTTDADDVSGVVNPGLLNPNNPSVTSPYHIDINTDLIGGGFLGSTTIPRNPLVSISGSGWNGYIAQFNQSTLQKELCTVGAGATLGPHSANCSSVVGGNAGQAIIWTAQVAVRINATTATKQLTYLNLLGGDCLSNASGNFVTPCISGSTGSGNYVVWSRLPFNANTGAISNYWLTTPNVAIFTQMYRTYPTLFLTNGSLSAGQEQYYSCGN